MKNRNRRLPQILLSVIGFLLSVSPMGAQTFEATVVDVQTREPLPFASIYVNKVSSTITNAVGAFSIKCDSADMLRITYVGYKPLLIQASRLPRHIGMQPMENQLKEVTITSIDLKNFIRKTTKEMRRQLRKNEKRESSFFYRQIAFADTTCIELIEAFLHAQPAVYLQNLALMKGRFAGLPSDSLHRHSFYTNFFVVSSLSMLTRYDYTGNTDNKPLTRNYKDFYDVDYDVLADSTDRIVALHFMPKPHITDPILAVTLYVDEQTHHLRKMEGSVHNVRVIHRDYFVEKYDTVKILKKIISSSTSTFNLTVNMTEDRGFVEVQSVYIDEQYEHYGRQIATRSILFNVGEWEVDEEGRRMWNFGDLHDYILEQSYDPEFWHNNEIVRRTPVEQKVMELFEHENLFGNMGESSETTDQ